MPFQLSEDARRRVAAVRARYPDPRAACLPALHVVQDEVGWVPEEAIDVVAGLLGLPPSHVFGVLTFYTMYNRRPIGKHHVQLCTNVACMALGAYDLLAHLRGALGIAPGETTPDGLFTLSEVECLACCGGAPTMLLDDVYHHDLTAEKVDRLLAECRARAKARV